MGLRENRGRVGQKFTLPLTRAGDGTRQRRQGKGNPGKHGRKPGNLGYVGDHTDLEVVSMRLEISDEARIIKAF